MDSDGSTLSAPLARALSIALYTARERHHAEVAEDHLLLAALCDPDGAALLAGCGADLAGLERACTARLDRLDRGEAVDRPSTGPGFAVVLARAARAAEGQGRNKVSGPDLVLALVDSANEVAPVLREAGVTAGAVGEARRRALAELPAARAEGPVAVMLHDDDETPMVFVVDVLVDVFGFGVAEAVRTTLVADRRGQQVVGSYDEGRARSLLSAARARIDAAGVPLRLTISR